MNSMISRLNSMISSLNSMISSLKVTKHWGSAADVKFQICALKSSDFSYL